MPQIRVASDNDECRVWWDGAAWHYDFAHHETIPGYVISTIYKAGYGMIFRNVPVPQGKYIIEADVTFTAFGTSDKDNVNTFIEGELNPHPLPFSSYEDYAARVRTDAGHSWDFIPHWVDRQIVKTPNIKAIIQEITNLPEWEEGDDICLFWHDHHDRSTHADYTTRMAETHHHNPNTAPQLTIHWQEDPLMESYTVGGDKFVTLYPGLNAAQSFKVRNPFDLYYVDVNIRIHPEPTFIQVSIYLADGEGHPFGSSLSRSEIYWFSQKVRHRVYRVRFWVTTLTLNPDLTYAIVMWAYYQSGMSTPEWEYDEGDAAYPRGHRSISEDMGETWLSYPNDDHIFALWGTPPAPPPPPKPPVSNWTLLDIEQTLTATGYKIVIISNVPCHLYMMWTNKEPNKHKIVGLLRGDLSLRETRYCFTGWHKNEQEEAGDTLTHTFIKEPWPVCETRWFTFKGEVDTLWTASAGPIFKKHRPSPPVTRYFYSDAHPEEKSVDGYTGRGISVPCELWPVLRAGPGTFGEDESRYFEIQIMAGKYTPKWCRLYRIIMLFDTSVIPVGSTILNAKLTLDPFYRKEIEAWPLFSMVVVKSFPDSNTGLVPADYHHLGATMLSNVILVSEDPVDGKYVFIFNTTGKYAVIPGGITKLGLRDYHYDCLNHEPPWARFYQARIQFESAESPYEARRPCLEVTYLPPA